MTTGLVAGKFDPPHRGHALLIDTARARCDRLIVLVFDHEGQTVPPEMRAAWLREIHPGVDVRVFSTPNYARLTPQDAAHEATRVREFLGAPVDVFFSSEDYGKMISAGLGARHFDVDRERALVPITGTMIRRSPAAMLDWLEAPVRAYYVPRVCIVGSESTGKSTLSARLADRYGTVWVGEYGREYSLEKLRNGLQGQWVEDEFVHIAFEQQRREDDAARRANRVLICDTDALATMVWSERYLDRVPTRWPLPPSRIALYLMPYPDVPFVADAIRDGEHKRYWMYERLVELFTSLERAFVVLRGTYEDRYEQAIKEIDALLEREVLD
ncbi:MAG TPA: AAA family ATPase [Candidatus Acidoferrales bacterium]|nr:AAA family ATPase [Candidatus Acidoferrales bacterium]